MSGEEGFRIIGAVRYCEFAPAFALPIVEPKNTRGQYFIQQTDELSERVVAFVRIHDFSIDSLLVLADIPISLGDFYRHAFISDDKEIQIDTALELKPVLVRALGRASTPLATKTVIAQVLGDSNAEAKARKNLFDAMVDALGDGAAQNYANSALRTRFWDLLVFAARHEDAAERIRRARGRLDAWFESNGDISVDISAIDLAACLKEPIEAVLGQLDQEFRGLHAPPERLGRIDLSGVGTDPSPEQILDAVRRSPRQEERLAIMLRALLVHPQAGLSALKRYQDPAQAANNAVRRILHALSQEASPEHWEFRIAATIPKILSESYPQQVGKMLYYFALHLADFKHVRGVIAGRLEQSHSMSVERYREQIGAALRPIPPKSAWHNS